MSRKCTISKVHFA